jgi:hypothetical protein
MLSCRSTYFIQNLNRRNSIVVVKRKDILTVLDNSMSWYLTEKFCVEIDLSKSQIKGKEQDYTGNKWWKFELRVKLLITLLYRTINSKSVRHRHSTDKWPRIWEVRQQGNDMFYKIIYHLWKREGIGRKGRKTDWSKD